MISGDEDEPVGEALPMMITLGWSSGTSNFWPRALMDTPVYESRYDRSLHCSDSFMPVPILTTFCNFVFLSFHILRKLYCWHGQIPDVARLIRSLFRNL